MEKTKKLGPKARMLITKTVLSLLSAGIFLGFYRLNKTLLAIEAILLVCTILVINKTMGFCLKNGIFD